MLERPDSPCIARCTTAVGDNVCRGCARSFAEISNWCFMEGTEREQVWQRLPLRQPLLDIAERLGTLLDLQNLDGIEWGVVRLEGRAILLRLHNAQLQLRLPDGRALPLAMEQGLDGVEAQLHQYITLAN
ncbi:DUF1289 domain-containing protein [Aquitalea sp.]|uniref:DUF1289 domain-containing protein n=1 Tax=Aquitalea sp. TaxID=1872623 RepID=UPI00258B575A|nr:DUF1289 domain-containing protein [Aquitalea sp.]